MLDLKIKMVESHAQAKVSGFWTNQDGTPKERNKGEMIALMHSELSEALEGVRKDKMDDHLPHRKSEIVELADLFIRLADYVEAYYPDEFEAVIQEKMGYNKSRLDHKPEVRYAEGGKKF